MKILAIETSCDETSAAVIKDGTEVLSNVISSQVEFHKKYGGIVPEVAARKHIEVINPIIKEALDIAGVGLKDLNAVAVTYGPGLVGSLLVGLCAAKALAYSLNIPLVGVNHLEGHIYANFLTSNFKPQTSKQISNPKIKFPFICLLVSGGHTMLILVEGHGKYKTLGRTRDDAAGEAFDKIARFLGLGYPGGPIIDQLAKEGNPNAIHFTRPMLAHRNSKNEGGIEAHFGYDFSFSGLKTNVVNFVNNLGGAENLFSGGAQIVDIAASFQQAIVDVLVEKAIRAAREFGCQTIALAGGVSANSALRSQLTARCEVEGLSANIPPIEYCTDNAAMIGCAAFYKLQTSNFKTQNNLELSPVASLRL